MKSASEVYDRVRERGRLGSKDEAETVVRDVLSSIVPLLDSRELEQLTSELPPELTRQLARGRGLPDDLVDREVFIGRLVNSMDTEYGYDMALGGLDLSSSYADNDAVLRAKAVFGTLREMLTQQTAQAVRSRLPDEVDDWWDES